MPDILQEQTGLTIQDDILTELSSQTGIPKEDLEQLASSLAEAVSEEEDEVLYQEWRARTARYIRKAKGKALDFFGQDLNRLNGQDLNRDSASRAIGFERFTGTAGETVPRGTKIAKAATSTTDQIVFETLQQATIPVAGYVDIPIRAQSYGDIGNLVDSTITELVDSVSGVSAVTNPAATTLGREEESDDDYRARILRAYDGLSRGTLPSIKQGTIDFRTISLALAEDADDSQTYLEVEGNLKLTHLPSTGILGLRNNEEIISYNGLDLSTNPHRLIGVQRAQYSTTAIEHSAGTLAVEYIPTGRGDRVTSAKIVESHGLVNVYIDDGSSAGPDSRLVQLVQDRLRGEANERNPGYRGHCIRVNVYARTAITVSPITVTVKLKPGYTASTIQTAIKEAIANYVNSLGVDVDPRGYAMACAIQEVGGVDTLTALTINGNTFDGQSGADVTVAPNQVARTTTANVSVFTA